MSLITKCQEFIRAKICALKAKKAKPEEKVAPENYRLVEDKLRLGLAATAVPAEENQEMPAEDVVTATEEDPKPVEAVSR